MSIEASKDSNIPPDPDIGWVTDVFPLTADMVAAMAGWIAADEKVAGGVFDPGVEDDGTADDEDVMEAFPEEGP